MTVTAFFSPARPSVVRRLHDGPLGRYVDDYALRLVEQRFSRVTARRTLRLAASLSRWLERRNFSVNQLDEAIIGQYQIVRARTRPLGFGDSIALRRFLEWMREKRFCTTSAPRCAPAPHRQVREDYARYLAQDIGLSERTIEHYTDILEPFLRAQFGADGPNWSGLTGIQIRKFFEQCAKQHSSHYLQRFRAALRSFLRYLEFRGATRLDLSNCIPRVNCPRLAGLPKSLSSEQLRGLLDSVDRNTAVGKRDYAILLSLARLGLRANEIRTLELDDIDWQNGLLSLNAKGGERPTMPLPPDVGKAIYEYLRRGRPRSQSRRVFLRHNAPHTGYSRSSCISYIVKQAMVSAGIDLPYGAAHLLRHTLATDMVGRGASLREIGQVLRHRRPNTTRIYAKVDVIALQSVALPWPEGVQ
jgi:site-specific recombinase XerD